MQQTDHQKRSSKFLYPLCFNFRFQPSLLIVASLSLCNDTFKFCFVFLVSHLTVSHFHLPDNFKYLLSFPVCKVKYSIFPSDNTLALLNLILIILLFPYNWEKNAMPVKNPSLNSRWKNFSLSSFPPPPHYIGSTLLREVVIFQCPLQS